MKLKIDINKIGINKKGSYVLESVITMPIFIIAIVVMTSIILLYIAIENASFIMANELRFGAIKAHFIDDKYELAYSIKRDIENQNKQIDKFSIEEYGYRVNKFKNDNIIFFKADLRFDIKNPININSRAKYNLGLATRAYVGKEGEIEPLDETGFMENDEAVYIFPKSGVKYHNKNCTYMKTAVTAVSLNKYIKHKYGTCPLCMSKTASIWSLVYIFPQYGDNYHLSGCGVMSRHYITISKNTAKKRGYLPCSKCGG